MRRHVKTGSVLLETIAAMAVLSICAAGLHMGLRQALFNHALAQDYATAQQLLRQAVAERELQPEVVEYKDSGTFPKPYERFQYRCDMSKVETPKLEFSREIHPDTRVLLERSYLAHMGRLRVQISWQRAGNSFTVVGETLVAPGVLWQPPEGGL